MIDTIILDLDGTLLQGKLRHYQCYSDILQKRGFVPLPIEEYWQKKRTGLTSIEILKLNNADVIYDHFIKSWLKSIEMKKYLLLDYLHEKVLDVLSGWKQNEKSLIIATRRNNAKNLDWQLKKLGVLKFVDQVIIAQGMQKDICKSVTVKNEIKNLNPGRTIWIGDTEEDIQGARALGIQSCALSGGLRDKKFLLKFKPNYLKSDLYSVSAQLSF